MSGEWIFFGSVGLARYQTIVRDFVVPDYRSGFRRARLPAIGFVESTDEFAFSFIDNVVRGCHLIPAFDTGQNADLLPWPRSISRCLNPEDTDDWSYFYVSEWTLDYRSFD